MTKLYRCLLTALWFCFALVGFAAETQTKNEIPSPSPSTVWLADATLEPYGMIGWQGLNGEARLGAGANIVTHITRGLSLWGFGESENTAHSVIDRAGLGLRFEGSFGPHIRGDAGVAGAYDLEHEKVFVRLPVGLTFLLLKSKSFEGGLRLAYAFDISGAGENGTAHGRAFIGPTGTIKW
jgi:hypothetical protein